MELLVALLTIVIGIIIDNNKKKAKEVKKAATKRMADPPVVSPIPQKSAASVQQMMENAMTQKQQELKKRLQQKYGEAPQRQAAAQKNLYSRPAERKSYARPMEKNPYSKPVEGASYQEPAEEPSITSRVAENIKEESVDELRLEQEREKQSYDTFPVLNAPEESELMKQIDDLMIMGYTAEISNSRDFVAEGIAMLNQYELSELTL